MLVGNACGLVDLVLVTMGRTSWNLANAAAALTLNVAIDLLLIPRIGISGAAIGWAVAIVCNNIVPVLQIHHAYGFNPLSSRWFKLLGAVAALFGAIPGLALLASHDNSVVVGAALILGAGSYVGLIWHWREDLGVSEIFQRRRGSVAGSGVGGSVRPEVAVGAQLPERGHDG
jgi:O-antigen/teichoic acid export membrane protein